MQHQRLSDREQSRLEACSSEPIRTPGTVQAHGAFFAVDHTTGRIAVASENAAALVGVAPNEILGRPLGHVLGDAAHHLGSRPAPTVPLDLEIDGEHFDAIVHESGPLTFVELEPQLPFRERESTSAVIGASHRLASHSDRAVLLTEAAREFSTLAGFDRTMIYHFHPDGHGEVVAELHVDGMEPYLGLHFPASDIPAQARALYLTKLSRAIVSTEATPVPLVTLPDREPDQLDLSRAELRSVSPFHLQFMRNMGQASTVSFSLIRNGGLIGMITCAHRTERRIPYFLRQALEGLANQVALQLGAISTITDLGREIHARDLRGQLLGKMFASDNLSASLLSGQFTLLDVIPADAAVISLDGIITRSGGAPTSSQADAALADLSAAASPLTTDSLSLSHPELAASFEGFAGLMFVPLGREGDFLAFFRREVARSIDWLGDLAEQNRSAVLSPRLSFSAWRESVTGRSMPWDDLPVLASALAGDLENALVRRHESHLATLAMVDPLTGLANRRHLMEQLATVAPSAGVVSLLFADLDDFKRINDSLGHDAGDAVIVEVGRRLTAQTRGIDLVVRLGGDEFVVMCSDLSPEDAHSLARRVAQAIRVPIPVAGSELAITASIGVVTLPSGLSPAEMVDKADAAMYRAKQSGKDKVAV